MSSSNMFIKYIYLLKVVLKLLIFSYIWKQWNSSTLATSCEELTDWKRLWCWGGLGAGGEGDDPGWDGWMASRTRWTWVWVNSRIWRMDRGAWRAAIHGVAKSRTRLSDWTELKLPRAKLINAAHISVLL